jgi:hypothetical protein
LYPTEATAASASSLNNTRSASRFTHARAITHVQLLKRMAIGDRNAHQRGQFAGRDLAHDSDTSGLSKETQAGVEEIPNIHPAVWAEVSRARVCSLAGGVGLSGVSSPSLQVRQERQMESTRLLL